jgi:uncharacterized repeat protein (TIGR03803 family)
MRGTMFSIELKAALVILTVGFLTGNALAAHETKLHNFGNGTDGTFPAAGLVVDSAGNLYGTTPRGGTYDLGTVFELSPNGSGGWTEKKLHNFGLGTDGQLPEGSLTFDAAGDLYGTTYLGGLHGRGTVFELSPNGRGGWTETKLHSFNGADGAGPTCNLVFDAAGNLYGTTYQGGSNNLGTVFELLPNGSGGWTEKKLHNFGTGTDGTYPYAGLTLDNSGNLYGTTFMGGSSVREDGCGTVFEVSPNGSGGWTEKKLHIFRDYPDGCYPVGGVIFDSTGNLYGTSDSGGLYGYGAAVALSPNANGGWTEKVMHSFFFDFVDGAFADAGLVIDAGGNLYGTTQLGGTHGNGSVFELSPNGRGGWNETVLRSFNGGNDGTNLLAPLTMDSAGNLYSTTYMGGTNDVGIVFEITH